MENNGPASDLFANLIPSLLKAYNSIYFRILLLTVVLASAVAIIALDLFPVPGSNVKIGKPSPMTIKADRNIRIIDYERTDSLRDDAEADVVPVFKRDDEVIKRLKNGIDADYKMIRNLLSDDGAEKKRISTELVSIVGKGYDLSDAEVFLSLTESQISESQRASKVILDDLLSTMVRSEDIAMERANLLAVSEDQPADVRLAAIIGASNLKANYLPDIEATENKIRRARDSVEPVQVVRQKGEVIVSEGKIVTSNQQKSLRDMGLLKMSLISDSGTFFGLLLSVLTLILAGTIYLREFQKKIYKSNLRLFLLSIILLTILAIGKGLAPIAPTYVIPVAAAAMIATILLNYETGVMMAVLSGLLLSLAIGSDSQFIFMAVLSSLAGVYLTAHISYRSDLTRAGFWLMFVMGFLSLIVSLSGGVTSLQLAVNVGWGVIGGFFATMLTIAGTQFLEYSFNLTTDMRLLELANPSQKLLRKLMTNAPGTYNHSIISGNLAESAAERVGANPLLARVGAYYHDIGKIRRPFFFVENQFGENPHDKTKPNLSSLIITAHVREGVELAIKSRLPKEIVKIINQHHGTGLVSYFYNQAKQENEKEQVSEVDFRYPGEKPVSREAALVMLADSSEAAVRTIAKQTPKRIEQMVKKVIQAKLDDGQLDQCDLTLGDIQIIGQIYTHTLTTMYHSRIDYPTCELPRQERGVSPGSIGKQPIGNPRRSAGT